MKSAVLLTGLASALALASACTPADLPSRDELPQREGYRAHLERTPWALDGISKDGSVVWIRTAESGCNQFHHVSVKQAPGGLRLVAFDVVYTPERRSYGCLLFLLRPRHRVELPRPSARGEILGECVPRDPRERCALLHAVAGLREGQPERDPWLG
jgi:hypothetical protein